MMFAFAPYVLKSLWRHRVRTILTLSGAAVAIFVFSFVASIQEGLDNLSSNEDAQKTLIVFQENRFCPSSSRLPEDYARKISSIAGVRSVMPVQVWTNNCRASLDIVVFNGVPPRQLQESRDFKLLTGSWGAFESERNAALVGRNVAARRGLKPGATFSIGEITIKVAGIFSSDLPQEENVIYTNLLFLQNTSGLDSVGMVTQFEVALDKAAEPDEVTAAIDTALKSGPVATTTRSKGAFQTSTLSDLVDLIRFAHWLGYACVALVLSIVATTMVMSVQDRVREYAVLQTLGVRPWRVFRIVLAESLILCVGGGTIGTIIAVLVLQLSGLAIGAEGVTIALRSSTTQLLLCISGSFLTGLIAGSIPAVQAAFTPIVRSLRA